MTEIEAKILDIDLEKLKLKLASIGAQQSFEAEFFAIYFDDSATSLGHKRSVLRIRKEGEEAMMTFKSPSQVTVEGINTREELEVKIGDFEMARQILHGLGYHEVLSMRKIRTQFEWNDVHIVIDRHIDELDFIPPYLEIEAPTHAQLLKAAKKLGFKQEQLLDWNAAKVKAFYERKHEISL